MLYLLSRRWREDPFRKANNERFASSDAIGCKVSARLILFHTFCAVILRDGQLGLALHYLAYVVLAEGLAAFVARRRAAYVAWREVIVTLLQVQYAWTLTYGALNSSSAIFNWHRGSRLRLMLTQLAGPPVFLALYTLNSHLLTSWNIVALPLVALVPLSFGRAMCERVLRSPGIEAPKLGLFHLLNTLHMPLSPLALVLDRITPPSLMQACLAINAWSNALWCVALPLCMLHTSEQRARKRFRSAHALRAVLTQSESGGRVEDGPEVRLLGMIPLVPVTWRSVFTVYLVSSLVWCLATSFYLQ